MQVEHTIRDKVSAAFAPSHIELLNESHMHSVPANSETHFKLVLVSEHFRGVRKDARHQQVYACVA
ncbi:MAG: BolA/IbaG family iron-sulfur metabolism protein, partial [Spongiibacter sp.]|nr:BolA/IbaG family iron-sulfur metabolism protein [Spongiibacter sp.]